MTYASEIIIIIIILRKFITRAYSHIKHELEALNSDYYYYYYYYYYVMI